MAALRVYALPLLLSLLGGAALLMAWPSPEADAQPAHAVPAAGFDGGGPWHNSPPLTLEQLRGRWCWSSSGPTPAATASTWRRMSTSGMHATRRRA
ncbi:exported hypothetical protein [Stenotrophomonas thermophila]|nr:exported hypothetical protein [Stenotrophomonas maltophilia]